MGLYHLFFEFFDKKTALTESAVFVALLKKIIFPKP